MTTMKSSVGEKSNVEIKKTNISLQPSLQSIKNQAAEKGIELVEFGQNDPGCPYNWSSSKKMYIIFMVTLTVLNSTISSAIAGHIGRYIAQEWQLENKYLQVLPTSIYIVGYIVGPLVWGPYSEEHGRKSVITITFLVYLIFTLATAVSPNFAALLIFRLITGTAGACPVTIGGGVCTDLYNTPKERGRAMAVYMAATCVGMTIGPAISGYVSPINWRLIFCITLALAIVTFIPLIFVPETYHPKILTLQARRLRKETGRDNIKSPSEMINTSIHQIFTVVLSRPLKMLVQEPLVLFTCLYLSFCYGVFYLLLASIPFIYEPNYGFNAGEEGLTFLSIALGSVVAAVIYLVYDSILQRAQARKAPWSQKEEFRRLPLACFAGPFLVIACFWIGWSARPNVHWIVPTLGGIPFGIGLLLTFISLINYLVDAYKLFAASAIAASGTSRSIWGAVLPFAGRPMYVKLGVPWACSLLGFVMLALATIPFIFLWKGDQIRKRSKFCQYLLLMEQKQAQPTTVSEVKSDKSLSTQTGSVDRNESTSTKSDDMIQSISTKPEEEKV